jgi:diguanylate cyclase (GGDEF)-like protein
MILRPLAELTRAASSLGQGDLSARTGLEGSGEVARLGRTFDLMASQLEQHTHHLERLVDERTGELEATNTNLRRTAEQLTEANEKLEELARTDSLTGLFNRRYLKETLQYYFALARRGGRPIALAMLDVDFFKAYNDTHGHPAGDEILKAVAETIRERIRSTDIPCRYGGEEFAILFPDTDAREAFKVAEFLRQKLEDRPFPNEETQPGGVLTVSIGVAGLGPDLRDPVELIQRADAALYRAKGQGRNRTVLNE